jgi:hypothetical protein
MVYSDEGEAVRSKGSLAGKEESLMRKRITLFTVVLLLTAGCSGTGDDGGDEAIAPTTTVEQAATTSTSSEASSVEDATVTGWVRVTQSPDLSSGDGSQEMNGIVGWEGGFVAVGSDGDDLGRNAAVWVSDEGLEWSRVVDPDGLDAEGWQTMNAVITGGPGLVAVGTSAPGLHKDDAAVWTSIDGLRWNRVADDSGVFTGAGDHHMSDVVVGGPGFVAVGSAGSVDTGVAAVWTSQDGVVWSRVAHDDEVFGGEGWQFMASVTLGDRGFVAVGGDGSGGDLDAAVWTSPDGAVWSRVIDTDGALAGSGDQAMTSIARGGPGFVAVGKEKPGGDFDSIVWTSPDGASWTRIDTGNVFSGPGDQVVVRIAEVSGGLMAVGYQRIEDRDAQVWESTDGLTWIKSTDPNLVAEGIQELHSLASNEQQIIAVGYSGDIASNDAAVWHRLS